jgi:hypothetical protein
MFVDTHTHTSITSNIGGFEYFKRRIPEEHNTPAMKLAVAWTVGVAASLACFPIDTVKRRVMLDGTIGFKQSEAKEAMSNVSRSTHNNNNTSAPRVERVARGTLVYVREMYNTGGIGVFYRGCILNALKSAPGAALTFVANDYLKAVLAEHREK